MTRVTNRDLPQPITSLLNGRNLSEKLGHTFLLASSLSGDWPHLAMLSVGEVLASSPRQIRLALWASNGTTAALRKTGRGLLLIVLEGVTYKIRISAQPVEAFEQPDLVAFKCHVERCDEDVVGYARVTHGIEFVLEDRERVLDRWSDQVESLRRMEDSDG